MTEQEIRKIVQDEIKRSSFRLPKIPPHTHNTKDNIQLQLSDIVGTAPVEFSLDQTGTYNNKPVYGYASPNQFKNYGNGHAYNFVSGLRWSDSGQIVGSVKLGQAGGFNATVPISIISGDAGSSFTGGDAAQGTMVLFVPAGGTPQLFVRYAYTWQGVSLPLVVVP